MYKSAVLVLSVDKSREHESAAVTAVLRCVKHTTASLRTVDQLLSSDQAHVAAAVLDASRISSGSSDSTSMLCEAYYCVSVYNRSHDHYASSSAMCLSTHTVTTAYYHTIHDCNIVTATVATL
jgi:hypothetical protein